MKFWWLLDMEILVIPYVIRSLWNGNDEPPETKSDDVNNIHKIKWRS